MLNIIDNKKILILFSLIILLIISLSISNSNILINNPSKSIDKFLSLNSAESAAVDYFLKLDGIDGESTSEGNVGEIVLNSFSWGENSAGISRSDSNNVRSGKNIFSNISFSKYVDKSSPELMLRAASGKLIKEAILTVKRPNSDIRGNQYIKIKLSDLLVTSYSVNGQEGTPPQDSFSLNFSKIEFEYFPQSRDGSIEPSVKTGYDVKTNKGI